MKGETVEPTQVLGGVKNRDVALKTHRTPPGCSSKLAPSGMPRTTHPPWRGRSGGLLLPRWVDFPNGGGGEREEEGSGKTTFQPSRVPCGQVLFQEWAGQRQSVGKGQALRSPCVSAEQEWRSLVGRRNRSSFSLRTDWRCTSLERSLPLMLGALCFCSMAPFCSGGSPWRGLYGPRVELKIILLPNNA